MRMLTTLAALALLLALGGRAFAQGEADPPGEPGDEKPAEEKKWKSLDERKRAFMDSFGRRLAEIGKEKASPEQEEIARLESLKRDYEQKLTKAQDNLDRARNVVINSFKELVNRKKDKEEIETSCESIWLDYLRLSRDNKAAIYEYERALKGVDRRINFIRQREIERGNLPGLDYQKYYTADNLEIYEEDEGLDMTIFGAEKSHVSYYSLLKDFVLQMTGGGRGADKVIEKRAMDPPLVQMWKEWKQRNTGGE